MFAGTSLNCALCLVFLYSIVFCPVLVMRSCMGLFMLWCGVFKLSFFEWFVKSV